ncbi:MAG: NUDIX domain-containing protein, partial [Limisphaerales bacterium]
MTSSELQPWTVSESRHVVTSPWMNLRADVCETADGVKLDPFYVMEAPDWVHIVPFDSDDRLLVTRQYRHGNEQIQWEIPCGMVDEADA